MIGPLGRLLSRGQSQSNRSQGTKHALPLPYSWVLTNKLAVGPMPRTEAHWLQLQEAGIQSRFSCCYPEEEIFATMPNHWLSKSVPLPDHRAQETMQISALKKALLDSEELITIGAPLYLHCFAGRERSSLVAVGLTVRQRNVDVFTALDWVRRCHPIASPIYDHLVILEDVLKQMP